jgi:hypothetical protein
VWASHRRDSAARDGPSLGATGGGHKVRRVPAPTGAQIEPGQEPPADTVQHVLRRLRGKDGRRDEGPSARTAPEHLTVRRVAGGVDYRPLTRGVDRGFAAGTWTALDAGQHGDGPHDTGLTGTGPASGAIVPVGPAVPDGCG